MKFRTLKLKESYVRRPDI